MATSDCRELLRDVSPITDQTTRRPLAALMGGALSLALLALPGGSAGPAPASTPTKAAIAAVIAAAAAADAAKAAPPSAAAEAQPAPAVPPTAEPRGEVFRAIAHATEAVGVDAAYMTAVAARESGFDPSIHASNTTAAGLYQFTEDTWLRAVKMFGARHGLASYARQIEIDDDGEVSLPDDAVRAKLLELRSNAHLSALMAAELALDNKARLERLLGRPVSPAETYLAHLLGVSQAARMIDIAHSAPRVAGARLFPAAARSNPGVFRPAGHVASAGAIVSRIESYFDRAQGI